MAIQEQTSPVLVTVFCDECGVRETNDYLVPAGQDSLRVARIYLAEHKHWLVTPFEDLCPDCRVDFEKPSE